MFKQFMYICEYCGKEFDNCHKLGGHKAHCEKNPNADKIYKKFLEVRKKGNEVNKQNLHLHCQYCNKEVANKGCLVLHERHCKENPNRIPCKGNHGNTKGHPCTFKGETKLTKEFLKKKGETYTNNYKAGKFKAGFVGRHHTEESKKLISEKRKKYLNEHKEEHVWKRSNKFLSKPCQYLKDWFLSKNISFVEELTPFDDFNYSVDIAWPDLKIGIEVNGNQHYNNDGSLNEYYQKRHDLFESRGWKLIELHYSKCYKININEFQDILNLDIYDKNYVKEYFDKKLQKQLSLNENKRKEEEEKEQKRLLYKNAIISLLNESNIDFSKFGWVNKANEYLNKKLNKNITNINRFIKKYYSDFYDNENIFIRK